MGIVQSVEGCLENSIGLSGLAAQEFRNWLTEVMPHIDKLKEAYHNKSLPLLRVPEKRNDIEAARQKFEQLSNSADCIVFLGTGGSSLGGQTLAQFGGWSIPGEKSRAGFYGPRVRFYDNLDPRTLQQALNSFDLSKTRFVVTSKSGTTSETLVQTLAVMDAVRKAGLENQISKLFLGLTEPFVEGRHNSIRNLFSELGIPMLEHDPGVGGRYSVLTNVGLLPAFSKGLDVTALRSGANLVLQELLNAESPEQCAPAVGAAVSVGLSKEKGVSNMIMMPYADRLAKFSHWFVQLWAESLGKGGEGTFPIATLGPVDQHSQLQLFMDGPNCLMITIVRTRCAGTGPVIPADLAAKVGLDFLADRAAGDLVAAQQDAIAQALMGAGRPVRILDIDPFDEHTLGRLLMHFMLETILAAGLLGIDPFDQPAVETGKRLARESLSKT